MADGTLVHATCVAIGDKGVLIRGASGAGKTQTALTLLRRARVGAIDARFVSDDQTLLEVAGDPPHLIAQCPEPIRDNFEVYGYGIVHDPALFTPSATIMLVADLVEDNSVQRMRPQLDTVIMDVEIAHLMLPLRNSALCASAISAALGFTAMI
ncbi:MAG: HPr kinase/phosphatase C-terminal domain-containing protein [Pseudomonadota bacterium]